MNQAGEWRTDIVSTDLRSQAASPREDGRKAISNANLGWLVGLVALGVFVVALLQFRPV